MYLGDSEWNRLNFLVDYSSIFLTDDRPIIDFSTQL